MIEALSEWVKENNLSVIELSDRIYKIKDGGVFFLMLPKEGKIFDEELHLNLDDEDLELIQESSEEVDNILFQFGGRFYNTPFSEEKFFDNEFIKVEFRDFKFLGRRKSDLKEPFSHLGVHSEYELMNGTRVAKDWAAKCKFLGYKSLGIIDKNSIAGTLSFQMACDKAEIKPIFGETINVAYSVVDGQAETNELVVYVKNKEGWSNLLRINEKINVENGGYITEEQLLGLSTGLILVFSKESVINKISDLKRILKYIKTYSEHFEDVYYQIDSVDYFDEYKYEEYALSLTRYFTSLSDVLKPILIGDSYYLDPEEALGRIYLNESKKVRPPLSSRQHFKSLKEHVEGFYQVYNITDEPKYSGKTFFDILTEAIKNTLVLSEECNYKIETGQHKLPKFKCEGDSVDLFFSLLNKGFKNKVTKKGKNKQVYLERMEEEADLIVNSGFVDYFLILWDIIHWCKENNIYVGVGRGSVGGSLVAYCLDIIDIDPIQHDLLFERFLNKTRLSGERAKAADALPDIDLDFETAGKDLVKEYMAQKYGKDFVCSVGSYQRAKLKGVIKNFGRADGMPFSYVNLVTKQIQDRQGQQESFWIDLFEDANKSKILKDFIQKNPTIVNAMKHILNGAQVPSIHASAVVIVPDQDREGKEVSIFDWMPVRKIINEDGSSTLVSDWEGKYLERAGFLKEDILGLSQLDKFKFIVNLIEKKRGEKIVMSEIPLDDDEVFDVYRKGYCEDIFQFGSFGLKRYCKLVQPDSIEDIIAMNALYRPGPMGSKAHEQYADIKHGKKKPQFDFMLREVTEKTYGLYVYQEQIMKATHVLGKLTLAESDEVRTVMKKFDKVKMATFRDKFIKGAIENGCKADKAEIIWKKLERFSGYGFNRSHSAAYGLMSYYSAWFKVHYPEEFYTASLNYADKDFERTAILDEVDSRRLGIKVHPPDINRSSIKFQTDVKTSSLYWSLTSIKGFGTSTVKKILLERKKGKFKSVGDFLARMKGTGVGAGAVRTLILSGSFDLLEGIEEPKDRRKLLLSSCITKKEIQTIEEKYPRETHGKNYVWTFEQKALTGLGKVDYKSLLKTIDVKIAELYIKPQDFIELSKKNKKVCIAGKVIFYKEKKSKNGAFGIINMECNDKLLSAVIWSDVWDKEKEHIEKVKKNGSLIALIGKVGYDSYRGENAIYSEKGVTKIIDI